MGLLAKLFARHYRNAESALALFQKRVAEVDLGFDVQTQCRETEYPAQASFPIGMPSSIAYYLPRTSFGTVKKKPADVNDDANYRNADGIGLNRGCPIRLARALDVLGHLDPKDREEPIRNLRDPRSHFATVEELLWLTLWRDRTELQRGGELVPPKSPASQAKNVDWFFVSRGIPIYLEAKFRPTEWIRIADKTPSRPKLFDDVGSKFPKTRSVLRKCLAGISGYTEPDDDFFKHCEQKLVTNPGLNAILYRTLLGPVYVCSLDPADVRDLSALIKFPQTRDFPFAYPVGYWRESVEKRRDAPKKASGYVERGLLYFGIVPGNRPSPQFEPEFQYRYGFNGFKPDGEPNLTYVPPFLPEKKF